MNELNQVLTSNKRAPRGNITNKKGGMLLKNEVQILSNKLVVHCRFINHN